MRIFNAIMFIVFALFPALAFAETAVGQMTFERPNGAVHLIQRVAPHKDVATFCKTFMSDDWSGKTIETMKTGGWVLKTRTCG